MFTKLRITLAVILTFFLSYLYYLGTETCSFIDEFSYCDYYFGFPLKIWLVTDYISNDILLIFAVGMSGNVFLWLIFFKIFDYLKTNFIKIYLSFFQLTQKKVRKTIQY